MRVYLFIIASLLISKFYGQVSDCVSNGDVALIFPELNTIPGESICVPITTQNFNNIASVQTGINWNENVLRYSGFNERELSQITINDNGSSDGNLRVLWLPEFGTDAISLNDGATLLEICFDIIGDGSISSELTFVDFINFGIEIASSTSETNNVCLFQGIINVENEDLNDDQNSLEVIFETQDGLLNELIEIDVFVNGFVDIASFQFSISWDPNILEYSQVTNSTTTLEEFSIRGNIATPLSAQAVVDGQLTVSWNLDDASPRSIPDSTLLFTLVLNATSCGESLIELTDTPRAIEIAQFVNNNFLVIGAVSENATVTITCGEEIGTSCRERDSLALIDLYNSTDGPNWTNTWDLEAPLQEWHGITLNDNNCVSGIELLQNGLVGEIPSSISELSELTVLNLIGFPDDPENSSFQKLTGNIPSEIGELRKLKTLFLTQNSLEGEIPKSIGNLVELEELSLRTNNLTGVIPKELKNCINLKVLRLGNNLLEGCIPSDLCNLTRLEILRLENNKFKCNIDFDFSKLENLTLLILTSNDFFGDIPQSIGSLSKLNWLGMADNKFSGPIPSNFGGLQELTQLDLVGNNLSDEIPSELGTLANIEMIRLQNNNLQGCIPFTFINYCNLVDVTLRNNINLPWQGDFERFCEAEEQIGAHCDDGNPETTNDLINQDCECVGENLELNECRQRDSLALVALYNSTDGSNWTIPWDLNTPIDTWSGVNLNENYCVTALDLVGNNLNGSIDTSFYNLGNLTFLELSFNDALIGELNNNINKLPQLEFLSILGTNITGVIPNTICELEQLRILKLGQAKLTGEIPNCLVNLGNLEELFLGTDNMEGPIPTNIGNLRNLKSLTIWQANFSGEIPSSIGELENLEALFLAKSNYIGEIPSSIGNLDNLRILSLSDNQLTGCIPDSIFNLINLKGLNLRGNNLECAIEGDFSRMSNLESLVLNYNNFNGPLPETIGNLDNLTFLRLEGNSFSGCIPESYKNLCYLTTNPVWSAVETCDSLLGCQYDIRQNPGLSWGGDFALFCDGENQIGVPCNDGNPETANDQINENCECTGSPCSAIEKIINTDLCQGGSINILDRLYTQAVTADEIITTDSSGCQIVNLITITLIDQLESNLDTVFCPNDIITINGFEYNLPGEYVQNLSGVNGCDSLLNISLSEIGIGTPCNDLNNETVNDVYIDDCICQGESPCIIPELFSDEIIVQIGEEASIDYLRNDILPSDFQINILSALPNVILTNRNPLVFSVREFFVDDILVEYEVCDKSCDACSTEFITIKNGNVQDIVLTNAFSPNGTGRNNVLKFSDAEVILNSELWIYNRWGAQIFNQKNYTNDWDGGGYPDGVYFYVLKIGDEVIKKTLTILR